MGAVDLDLTRLLLLRVGVEAVELSEGSIYTTDLIEALCLEGNIGVLRVVADDIDLRRKRVNVTDATIDGCALDIKLRETEEEDTTEPHIAITTGGWNESFETILQTKECCLNVPSFDMVETVVGVE